MDDQNQQSAEDQVVDQNASAEETQQPEAATEQPTETPSTDSVAPEEQVMQIGKYSVKIVKSACIGAASCVAVSPAVFKMNQENIAVFLEGATDDEANIVAAAQSCPTKAIFVTDTEANQEVWPV